MEAAPIQHDRMARALAGYAMYRKDAGAQFRTVEEVADVLRVDLRHGAFDFDKVFQETKAQMRGSFAFGGPGFERLWERTEREFVARVIELLENWQREGRVA